jgi:hypothetical protein
MKFKKICFSYTKYLKILHEVSQRNYKKICENPLNQCFEKLEIIFLRTSKK